MGLFSSDTNEESASNWNGSRDVVNGASETYSGLEKRDTPYRARLSNGAVIIARPAGYPRIGMLYTIQNAIQVLRYGFHLTSGYCLGPTVEGVAIHPNNPGALRGLESDHPVDVSIPTDAWLAVPDS